MLADQRVQHFFIKMLLPVVYIFVTIVFCICWIGCYYGIAIIIIIIHLLVYYRCSCIPYADAGACEYRVPG